MKQVLFFLLVLFGLVPCFAWKIVIDPGHGGSETGAIYGAAQESEIVLKIAHELLKKLKSDPRFEALLTRNRNENVSLNARVKTTEKFTADLFLSLHANAALDRKAKGMEVYFQNQMPLEEENLFLAYEETKREPLMSKKDSESSSLGSSSLAKSADMQAIVEDLKRQGRQKLSLRFSEILQSHWSGHIRQAPFYVISKTRTPSVLIEVGFLSHPQESQKLLTTASQKEIAEKIYKAIVQYAQKLTPQRASLTKID